MLDMEDMVDMENVAMDEIFPQEEEATGGPAEEQEVAVGAVASPSRPPKNNVSKAARLPHFSQAWHKVTNNNFILNIVTNGYKIQFSKKPVQKYYKPRTMSKIKISICKDKILEFLSKNIIKIVSSNHAQFLSHIFPVPKK